MNAETADALLRPATLAVSLQLRTDTHFLMAAESATAVSVALPVDALAAVPAAAAAQHLVTAAAADAAAVRRVLAGVDSCVLQE